MQRLEQRIWVQGKRSWRPPPIRSDNSEAELECVRKRRNALCATRILADDDCFPPVLDVDPDPTGDKRFGNEIVDWTSEETLHLTCMKIDGDDMVDSCYVEEVGDHAGCDGSSVLLFLGLAGVGEIGHHRYDN